MTDQIGIDGNAQQLLDRLISEEVKLWVENGRLRYRGPRGLMRDELLSELQACREALITLVEAGAETSGALSDPATAHDPFPLTDIQGAYLLGRRSAFAYGGVGCHGYVEFVETRGIDVERLERAWRRLIDRHPMLRAVFDVEGVQRVLPEVPPFHGEVEDAGEQYVERRLDRRARMSHRLYDGAQWPLFSVAVTAGPDEAVLHLSFDLLIADFVSFGVLLDELEQLYGEPEVPLAPIKCSFKDYLQTVRAARDGAQRADHDRAKAWWRERLPSMPPRPELPLAPPSAAPPAPLFLRVARQLDGERWRKLQQAAGGHSLTCSSLLLAAFCETVGKWSRSPDFTLALPLLDRQPVHPDAPSIIGDFTTLSLFSARLDLGASFLSRARACQAQLWADLDHRSYSGIEAARDVAGRNGDSEAVFPVVFTSTVGQGSPPQGKRWAFFNAAYGITQTPQVWLDCQVLERADGLQVNLDYRSGVLRADMVEAMAEAFAGLLADLAEDPTTWEMRDPLPLPADQAARREETNATSAPVSGRLLHGKLLERCRLQPDATAVVSPDGRLTFHQLLQRARAIAGRLPPARLGERRPVAVVLPKGPDQVAAVLAVLLAGRPYLPIDTHQPAVRRAAILKDAGAVAVVTCADLAASEWPQDIRVTTLGAAETADGHTRQSEAQPPSTDELAYLIYTGGSTGVPKGVMISHAAAENTVEDLCSRLGLGPEDRVLGLSHLGFDLSVFDIFGVLGSGATLVLPDPDQLCDPSHWGELAAQHRVTVWNSVPAQMQMYVDYLESGGDAAPLKRVLLSGDWIPPSLPRRLWSFLPEVEILSLGGATEAAIWSVYHPVRPTDCDRSSIPYGRPLRNQRVHVLDAGLRPRPDWVAGDLYLAGQGLADGYVASPDNKAFVRHPVSGERLYRTGDLCRFQDDGELELLGREDLQVKIRGHRIELTEIENAALLVASVGAAAATVIGEGDGRQLALAVQPAPNLAVEQIDLQEVSRRLGEQLPPYMAPASIKAMLRLPLTGANKIDRSAIAKAIMESAEADRAPDGAPEAPHSTTERLVAKAFSAALGAPDVGRGFDFMDHGGNSLLAARAAKEIRRALEADGRGNVGFDELLVCVLQQRTVGEVSRNIDERQLATRAAALLEFSGPDSPGQPLALLALALDEAERQSLVSYLAPLCEQADCFSFAVRDDALFDLEPTAIIERLAERVQAELDRHLRGRPLVIVCQGDRAGWGLEVGRGLRDAGAEDVVLVALAEAAKGRVSPMAAFWSDVIERAAFYPYLGEVRAQVGARLNADTEWDEVAFGEWSSQDASAETLVRETLNALAP